MIRFPIFRASAVLACAAMAFAFAAAPAQAASITLNDSSCDSFSLSGTAPNQTLTCVVSNAPAGCTIAGPAAGTINVPITLTSQCASGSPNGWTWTGGNCANVTTQSCSAVSAGVGTVTYTVTPRNNIGAGNTPSKDVSWTNTPPVAPSGCTLGASNTNLPIGGGAVTLTATCTGGGAPTSYAWTGNGLPTPTTTNVSSTSITATTTFTVTPSNAGGNGNTASVTVNVAGNVIGNCANYGTVLPMQTATWGQQNTWHSADIGSFGDNSVWLFKLFVPAGTPTSTVVGRFTAFEFGGPNTPRQISISPTACDFDRKKDINGVNGPLSISNGSTAEISFAVATPFIFGPAALQPGQTYYISVRNWQLDPTPQPSCGLSNCAAGMNDIPALP
jgi:hypothetical protein